jgi:hypothetical protein
MEAMLGFVVGYVLGTREGQRGHSEIKEAWHTIRTSDETRDLISRGLAGAMYFVQNGPAMIMQHLQPQTAGDAGSALRPTG